MQFIEKRACSFCLTSWLSGCVLLPNHTLKCVLGISRQWPTKGCLGPHPSLCSPLPRRREKEGGKGKGDKRRQKETKVMHKLAAGHRQVACPAQHSRHGHASFSPSPASCNCWLLLAQSSQVSHRPCVLALARRKPAGPAVAAAPAGTGTIEDRELHEETSLSYLSVSQPLLQ